MLFCMKQNCLVNLLSKNYDASNPFVNVRMLQPWPVIFLLAILFVWLATCSTNTSTSRNSQDIVNESSRSRSLSPRLVKIKVYVNRDIWKATREAVDTDVKKFIVNSLEKLFHIVNKHLRRLDNGGYSVQFDKTVSRLKKSDVKIKNTYIDRLHDNATKTFKKSNIESHTFTFQEAVQEMEGRSTHL